jgi:hypothetical protein
MPALLDDDLEGMFASLQKGDVVPTGAIEQWGRISRAHDFFRLIQMRCGRYIEALLRGQGRPVTVCCDGQLLRVLTDREAAPYQHRRFQQGMHKMRDAHHKAAEIDLTALALDERQWQIVRLQVQELYLKALDEARYRRPSGHGPT